MACTEQELKELLQQDASVTPALLDELLLHIGSTDSELRDGLIYPQLATRVLYDRRHQSNFRFYFKRAWIDV